MTKIFIRMFEDTENLSGARIANIDQRNFSLQHHMEQNKHTLSFQMIVNVRVGIRLMNTIHGIQMTIGSVLMVNVNDLKATYCKKCNNHNANQRTKFCVGLR